MKTQPQQVQNVTEYDEGNLKPKNNQIVGKYKGMSNVEQCMSSSLVSANEKVSDKRMINLSTGN
jgi:hypothetical protein